LHIEGKQVDPMLSKMSSTLIKLKIMLNFNQKLALKLIIN
jgi:hypothetical protein